MLQVCQWLKGVIVIPVVYPRFLNFFTLTFRALGTRQPNDVMSEMECTQLHSELFRCRHSTRQSHGLFALAKHLLKLPLIPSKLCLQTMVRDSQYCFATKTVEVVTNKSQQTIISPEPISISNDCMSHIY